MAADSPPPARNALQHAASSYLRSAMHQPVRWHQWGPEAFALAAAEDKPVLLDIGAVWCHWCHVMDRESYEDPALAGVINDHYVAIKVDRDERPDVDARYQAAVSAISGQGGWPLTGFLTPDGRPFFGGTYFPREDRYGRPGFERVLVTMAGAWKQRREEALESAASVMAAIEHNESFSGRSGELDLALVDRMVESALRQYDPRHGGFGSQPKFPHPSALDLLLDVAARTGSEAARTAALTTLERMARGGVYDQIGGGFHRYSVDERWVVPHFEKMLYDNSELLRNYVHAYQSFVDPGHARVARDIMRWLDEWMSDRERGGFYASQDADISLEDDGDYFTWTLEEARAVLSREELDVAAPYWDIGELGDMHHAPERNVLHSRFSIEQVAEKLRLPAERVRELLVSAKKKLYLARLKRPTPFIDRTLYTGWNSMAVSAYLEAGHILSEPEATRFALLTLNRILREGLGSDGNLSHVVAYPDAKAPATPVPGTLDDYAFTIHACVEAFYRTGEPGYANAAEALADGMIARFHDPTGGGFFDTQQVPGQAPLGALSARRKPLQDSPTPAGNPAAASALLRLAALNGSSRYRELAEDTLETFAGIVEHFGLYAATYGLALERLLLPAVDVVVVGEDGVAEELSAVASARYAVNKNVLRLSHARARSRQLPPVLRESVGALAEARPQGSVAMLCRDLSCLPPVTHPQQLLEALGSAV